MIPSTFVQPPGQFESTNEYVVVFIFTINPAHLNFLSLAIPLYKTSVPMSTPNDPIVFLLPVQVCPLYSPFQTIPMMIPISKFSDLAQLIGTLTLVISARMGRQVIIHTPVQVMNPIQPTQHVVTIELNARNFDYYLAYFESQISNSQGSSWVKVVVDEPQQ